MRSGAGGAGRGRRPPRGARAPVGPRTRCPPGRPAFRGGGSPPSQALCHRNRVPVPPGQAGRRPARDGAKWAQNRVYGRLSCGLTAPPKGDALMAIEQQETGTQIDQPVVTMTARATDKLKEVIAKQGRADLALRVYVTAGGCSGFSYGMTFAEGREQDDTLVETDGVRIVVDPMSAMYLKGSEIDFVDALMGGGFALRNPNAVSSCGCGQSFKTADQSGTAKACAH